MHARQMQVVELGRAAEEVHMRLDETRQHRAALGVDNLCRRSFEFFDGSAVADGDDDAVLDGNSLGDGIVIVHGQHSAVDDHQIRTAIHYRHRDSTFC